MLPAACVCAKFGSINPFCFACSLYSYWLDLFLPLPLFTYAHTHALLLLYSCPNYRYYFPEPTPTTTHCFMLSITLFNPDFLLSLLLLSSSSSSFLFFAPLHFSSFLHLLSSPCPLLFSLTAQGLLDCQRTPSTDPCAYLTMPGCSCLLLDSSLGALLPVVNLQPSSTAPRPFSSCNSWELSDQYY